jgi:hypothetical protein
LRRRLGFAMAIAWVAWVAASGCGGHCEDSQCAAGNACVEGACHKICTNQAQCPANYYCNDGQANGQPKNWCVASTYPVAPGPGQWHTACHARGGEGANSACDWGDQFACYGISTTDATSFCTLYGCTADSDCPGGWWCSTQNTGPNVRSDNATFGQTRAICLPRIGGLTADARFRYCAPCTMDHDCYSAPGMTQQHCVKDSQGNGFCAEQCAGTGNCAFDAACVPQVTICSPAMGAACASDDDCPPKAGFYQHCDGGMCTTECGSDGDCASGQKCKNLSVCMPRAGTCVGDGSFCSPCRSDRDCDPNFCLSGAPYSTERFCSVKATQATCNAMTPIDPPICPALTRGDNWKGVACLVAPADQCTALVTFASGTPSAQYVPGCWTVNR